MTIDTALKVAADPRKVKPQLVRLAVRVLAEYVERNRDTMEKRVITAMDRIQDGGVRA